MDVAAVREAAQTLRVIGEQRFDRGIRLFEEHCGPAASFGQGNPGEGVAAARTALDRAIGDAAALGRQQAMTAAALSTAIELIASVQATADEVTAADLARVSALLTQASAIAGSAARAAHPGNEADAPSGQAPLGNEADPTQAHPGMEANEISGQAYPGREATTPASQKHPGSRVNADGNQAEGSAGP